MAISIIPSGFSDVRLKPESGTVSAFVRTQGGDNFILEASREDIRNYVRDGNDLVIEFGSGTRLTIKDFFAAGEDYHNLILESAGRKHFVDFSHAVQGEDVKQGDGIEEARIRHHPVYDGERSANSSEAVPSETQAKEANIDYDAVVSSIDSGNKKGGFSGQSFLSALGGLGAIGAVAEYAYGDRGSSGDAPDPFADIPVPDPLVPEDPSGDDTDTDSSNSGAALRFFSKDAYMIETRIVKDPNVDAPIFSAPILFDGFDSQAGAAQIFLGYLPNYTNPDYLNVYARISGTLNNGEKVQLRNRNGEWQDAEYNGDMGFWHFKDEPSKGDLYQIESRIVDATVETVRQGASLAPNEFYEKWEQEDLPPIARIDYTQERQDISELVGDINNITIGGRVMGKFDNSYKIQIRIGGGWYDAVAVPNGEGYSWRIDTDYLPTLASSAADDKIQLESNTRDTIVYRLLDEEDATGGNGSDLIHNFTIGKWGNEDVDRIDIASLLLKYNPLLDLKENGGLSHYLDVRYDGKGNTQIFLDRDGVGGKFQDTSLLFTLVGVQTSLDELYNNGQLIVS